jgi:hypothetical protein
MIDLLIGDHALGTQGALAMGEVSGLDPDHIALAHLQIHRALHPTKAAVRGYKCLRQMAGLSPATRWRARGLKVVVELSAAFENVLVDTH